MYTLLRVTSFNFNLKLRTIWMRAIDEELELELEIKILITLIYFTVKTLLEGTLLFMHVLRL